jgi:hypothetical protein
MSKRKVFDAQKMRVHNTEASKFVAQQRKQTRSAPLTAQQPPKRMEDIPISSKNGELQRTVHEHRAIYNSLYSVAPHKSTKWRQQSEQFREAMRAARQVKHAQEQASARVGDRQVICKFFGVRAFRYRSCANYQ